MSFPSGAFSSKGATGDKIPKGYRSGRMQQFTPEQMDLFQQMFGHLGPDSFLSRLASGDQSMFEEVEAPALRQFGEMQGNLASRFSGMGMGGRHSSGFGNTMNSAASDFAQNLQSQRLGMRNQALQDLMGMSNSLLGQRPYENLLVPKQQKQSGWNQFLQGVGSGIPGMISGLF